MQTGNAGQVTQEVIIKVNCVGNTENGVPLIFITATDSCLYFSQVMLYLC